MINIITYYILIMEYERIKNIFIVLSEEIFLREEQKRNNVFFVFSFQVNVFSIEKEEMNDWF